MHAHNICIVYTQSWRTVVNVAAVRGFCDRGSSTHTRSEFQSRPRSPQGYSGGTAGTESTESYEGHTPLQRPGTGTMDRAMGEKLERGVAIAIRAPICDYINGVM